MPAASEKRHFERISTTRPAQLSTLRLAPCDCVIVDYCPQGVMIQFSGTSATRVPKLHDQLVTIKFSTGQQGNEIHRFSGRVVREVATGLGIQVAQFHPTTYAALSRTQTAYTGNTQPASAGGNAHADDIIALCQSHFMPFMRGVLKAFFTQIPAAFDAATTGALSMDERCAFNSAPGLLMTNRATLEQAFLRPDYGRVIRADLTGTGTVDQLSLVAVDDFEDWLNAAQSINLLEAHFKAETVTFTTRYSRLVVQDSTVQNNPYCPFILISTLRDAIAGYTLSLLSKALVYATFQAVLEARLGEFYQALIQAMPKPTTVAPAAKPATPPVMAETASDPLRNDNVDSGELAYKLDHIMRHLHLTQPDAYAYGVPAPVSNTVVEQDMLRTTGNLWSSLRQMRNDQTGQIHRPAQPEAAQADLLQNILEALEQLRTQAVDIPADSTQTTFKQRLINAVPQLGYSEIQEDQHFQTLELFDALLSQPLANAAPASDIAALLKKLELPLLKLALTDEHFLGSDTHQARQTVNLFERYYVAADDTGKLFDSELLLLLEGLASRIVDQFEIHPAIFDEVNAVLQKLLVPLEEARQLKSSQLLLNAEAQEKISLTRELVGHALLARIGEHTVPTLVVKLIQSVWERYLELLCLRHGNTHAEFIRALDVLDDLRDALSATTPLPAVKRHALLDAVNRGVKAVVLDASQPVFWARTISVALEHPSDIAYSHYPHTATTPTPLDHENTALSLLQMGDWLGFQHDSDTQPVPFQLIWCNPARSRFMFINRSATVERALDRYTLASNLESGAAQTLGTFNTPFMQRSAHSIMLSAYERLYQQAIHDPESGLLNRKGLMNLLNKLFIPDLRDAQAGVLCLLVFDQLKAIHQSCEQADIDASISLLTSSMRLELRPNDAFSRLGEDTFVILFQDRPVEEVHAITLDMLTRIAQHRIFSADKSFAIGVNAGLAEINSSVESASALLKNAASACVAAKSHGINSVQIYQQDSAQIQDEEALFEWAGLIDKALNENLLYLRCQKIQPVQTDTDHLPHYEILLGLDPTLNTNPQGFVRAAEKWNRSADLDLWVVHTSLAWIEQNAARLSGVSGFSINLSGLSLINQRVLDALTKALSQTDFPVDKIIFEVTETAAIENLAAAQEFIATVKALGCRVSLDDFGSGYSSFAYLKNLDVDYLKIDGAFVRDVLKDKADRAMVKSMHDVGHALGLKTIAEYVENTEIFDCLREIGVDYAQGWGIAKPERLDTLQLD
jgi:diguanylate cyclase (GGDEF)-like protein